MKKILFLLLFLPIAGFAQGLDFETISFEIKAVTLTNRTRALLSYDLENEQIPTRIKKFDTRSRQEIYNASQSFIYDVVRSNFITPNTKNPVITIAPLSENNQYAFGDNGTAVKNIAYKPSNGGNIFSAYCAGVYAANNARN